MIQLTNHLYLGQEILWNQMMNHEKNIIPIVTINLKAQ